MDLGDGKKGDCTMLDALIPAIDAIQSAAESNASFNEVYFSHSLIIICILYSISNTNTCEDHQSG